MIPFDLERALAGDKVITLDGRPVTQLVEFKTYSGSVLFGLDCDNETIEQWLIDGRYHDINKPCRADLYMSPKPLSGFVNCYTNGTSSAYDSKETADCFAANRIACIDLSQHNEGEGL